MDSGRVTMSYGARAILFYAIARILWHVAQAHDDVLDAISGILCVVYAYWCAANWVGTVLITIRDRGKETKSR